jgi:hypothetical protein
MNTIRAIETSYAGCSFRSRLEARWALWMDACGVTWEYEPEGYEMDGLRYLPDFWLPERECWAEVKPKGPDTEEKEKGRRLHLGTNSPVLFLIGTPGLDGQHKAWSEGQFIHSLRWYECGQCKAITLIPCACPAIYHRHHALLLYRAYEAARSARFERYANNTRRVLQNAGIIR